MNIFILDECPIKSAQQQCDKHVVKMIVESSQMLSTAHRLLDGIMELRPSKSGKRMVKYWKLSDKRENVLYKNVHEGHPCTLWSMKSRDNYMWHYRHWLALCEEYQYRYEKVHSTQTLHESALAVPPKRIPWYVGLTEFPLAMKDFPQCIFPGDPVKSYQSFYQTKQKRFKMVWKKRDISEWFNVEVA